MVKKYLETGSDNFDPFVSSSPSSHPNTNPTFNSHTSIHFQSQSSSQTSPNQFDVCSESASNHDHHHHGTGSEIPLMGPYFTAPLNFNKEGVWRIIAQMKVAGGVLVTAGWWVDVV
ncbi:hypothetical protein BKA69DRAFT_1081914 [Paraphysoderma sedebokerense]|nr:hypothetical protein BKA69DRAFT_1081914 [Paraphysoderma sedebokerense]